MNIAWTVNLFSTRMYVFCSLFPRETIQRIRSLFFLILVKEIVNAVVSRLAEKNSFIDRISDFSVFTFQISAVLPYLVHLTDVPLSNFI